MKKLLLLIFLLITSFTMFLFVLYKPKDYTIKYKINDYSVEVNYVKNKEIFHVFINDRNKVYPVVVNDSYNKNRKIVSNIKEYIYKEESCLEATIFEKKYPVCYKGNQLIDYRLLSDDMIQNFKLKKVNNETVLDKYNKTKIYNYDENKYFIWNYKGYDYLSSNSNNTINISDRDEYDNLLAYQLNNFLITPNYENKYYFKELLVINTKNLELFSIDLGEEISYQSYIQGSRGRHLYLIDKKSGLQYQINIPKKEIKKVGSKSKGGIHFELDKKKNISMTKLINENILFQNQKKYKYKLIEKKLYLKIAKNLILLSNEEVKGIIRATDEKVYYVSESQLFSYNFDHGETKLLENSEWNFNYINKVFIFN